MNRHSDSLHETNACYMDVPAFPEGERIQLVCINGCRWLKTCRTVEEVREKY